MRTTATETVCRYCRQVIYLNARGDWRTVYVLTAVTTDCYRAGQPHAFGHEADALVIDTVYSGGQHGTTHLSGPDGAATIARVLSDAIHDHYAVPAMNGARLVSYSIHGAR